MSSRKPGASPLALLRAKNLLRIAWTARAVVRLAAGGEAAEANARKDGGKWIQGAIKSPGSLHRSLHIPQGEKIPAKKLAKAEHSSNPTLRKRAVLAKTLKGLK
jgi:hypothetical protein